jgi:hypothetical protein
VPAFKTHIVSAAHLEPLCAMNYFAPRAINKSSISPAHTHTLAWRKGVPSDQKGLAPNTARTKMRRMRLVCPLSKREQINDAVQGAIIATIEFNTRVHLLSRDDLLSL